MYAASSVLTPKRQGELRANLRTITPYARDLPSNDRPVLLPEDVAALKGKPEAAVRAVLEILSCFPGSRIQ